MAILEAYAAPDATVRPAPDAPRFRRPFDAWWWAEWAAFEAEAGREPLDVPEFVAWSQARQAEALAIAAGACKERFPACGGFILWMGHDSFPCTANTSVIDFHGEPKPALAALAEVFRG
jgi:beta-mannosidase